MKSAQRIECSQACLFGGAIGDALGASVAPLDWQAIRERHGEEGLTLASSQGETGRVTGATQTVLFTAEGMLRSFVRIQERDIYDPVAVVHHALIRWVTTQGVQPLHPRVDRRIGLVADPRLHARRTPDETCLTALSQAPAFGWQPHNEGRQCGGIVRVAPIGLFPWSDFLLHHRDRAFSVACESARCTHGHPCTYLAAGMFAYLLNGMLESERTLESLVPVALDFMDSGAGIDFYIDCAEERDALPRSRARIRFLLETVLDLHVRGIAPTPQGIDALGDGRVAEEALAIALWCALAAKSYRQGVLWAVNHSGDSNGTGTIAGSLLGLRFGLGGLPPEWLETLELRDWLDRLGHDLQWLPKIYVGRGYGAHDAELRECYPDW